MATDEWLEKHRAIQQANNVPEPKGRGEPGSARVYVENAEATRIRGYGKAVLVLSIILALIEIVVSALSERGFDLWGALSMVGLGQLVYIACRGAAEVIRLLHQLALGVGTINPATNGANPIAPGSSILELLGKHVARKE